MLSGLFYSPPRRMMIGDPTHDRLATLGGTPLATLGRDPPSGRVIKRCRQTYGCRRLYPATRDTSHPRSVPRRDSRSLQGRRLGILQVPNRRPYPVDYRPAPHLVVVLRRNCARTAVREAVPASRIFIQLHATLIRGQDSRWSCVYLPLVVRTTPPLIGGKAPRRRWLGRESGAAL